MRPAAVFVGIFVGVLVVLLAGVGQLGKIDRQTLAVVIAIAFVGAAVGAWRALRREP
jgi:uncharacterized membrane protein YfcA